MTPTKKTKRKDIFEEIEIPEGINVELSGNKVKMSNGENSMEREFDYEIKKADNKLTLEFKHPTKMDKKVLKTTVAHLVNMICGLEEKYSYKLQIASVHFPMNVSVQGDEVVIKNFLGEKQDRKAKILPGVEVKVEGEIISVDSCNKESAGQTAANIEKATRITNRDRRIFQDGIYMTEKEKGRRKSSGSDDEPEKKVGGKEE